MPSGPAAAGSAVTGLLLRRLRSGALVVGGLAAGISALVASQHAALVAGPDRLASLAALAGSPAVRTLFGPPRALDDAGAFTVWRTGAVVTVLVVTWSVLAATRTTRAEEDAGRSALLLSGTVGLRQVVLRSLAVLAAADLVVGLLVGLALLASGTAATGAVLHGSGVALVGWVFAALGVLAAQVLPRRRSATGAAVGLLLLALLLRMVADGEDAVSWLRWVTPFGVQAELRPYAGDRLVPLLVLACTAGTLAAAALVAAGHRDVGAGLLHPQDGRRPRTALLGHLPGFLLRRSLHVGAGWAVAVGGYFLLIGLLATSLTAFLRAQPRLAELAAHSGAAGLETVDGYVAALFGLLAVPVGLFTASRLAADVEDEDAGRLAAVLATPVTGPRWLAWHTGLLLVAALGLCLTAGLATWAGASWVSAPLSLDEALLGAVNALPVAALSLGAAAGAVGWLPGAVLPLGAVPVVGGFVWLVLADSLSLPASVRVVSPFAHLPAVPAQAFDPTAAAGMLAVAAALAVLGVVGRARRDLRR